MTPRTESLRVDIYHHPDSVFQLERRDVTREPGDVIIKGDLHGNTINLLFFLIREKVFEISEQDYDELVAIYRMKTESLHASHLLTFQRILSRMKLTIPTPFVKLIGDELCDRGNNDYFTLLLLRKMSEENVLFEILLSNHGVEFITSYDELLTSDTKCGPLSTQYKSMQELIALISNKNIDANFIKTIIKDHYLKHIKLISYEIDVSGGVPEITLLTHAPTDIHIVERLAKKLGLIKLHDEFDYSDLNNVIRMIDAINNEFQTRMADDPLYALDTASSPPKDAEKTVQFMYGWNKKNVLAAIPEAIYEVTWNREKWHDKTGGIIKTHIIQVSDNVKYRIRYVHGHDGSGVVRERDKEYVINVDGEHGKASPNFENNIGNYKAVIAKRVAVVVADAVVNAEILAAPSTPAVKRKRSSKKKRHDTSTTKSKHRQQKVKSPALFHLDATPVEEGGLKRHSDETADDPSVNPAKRPRHD